MSDDEDRLLHIYGQYQWHDDVQIVGNTEALRVLRNAIDMALEHGQAATLAFFVGDGEGYQVTVAKNDSGWEEWGRFPAPYTSDYAQEKREGLPDPRYFPERRR